MAYYKLLEKELSQLDTITKRVTEGGSTTYLHYNFRYKNLHNVKEFESWNDLTTHLKLLLEAEEGETREISYTAKT